MKKLLLGLLVFISYSAIGQITIVQNDMPYAGDDLYRTRANNNPFLNYQATGANHVWNFTNLTANVQDSALYQTVASTNFVYALTYADIFFNPNRANVALTGVDIPFNNLLPIANPYTFYYRSASVYKKIGYGVELAGIPVPIIYTSKDVIYNLPLNFGDNDSSFSAYNISLPTLAYYGYEQSRVNEVDGWGTINTPSGSFDALRVKTTLYGRDTINLDSLNIGFNIDRPIAREYKWLASNYRVPIMQVNTSEIFGIEIITDIFFYDVPRTLNVDPPLATILCPGSIVDVNYTETGAFNAGGLFSPANVFRAQLSNDTGSFANPVNIGSVTSTISGVISCTIPANTPPGTGYRIRVIATNPAYIGNDNGFDITIGAPPVGVASALGNTTFCDGGSVLLIANTDPDFTYQWQLDGIDITGETASDINATLNGDYTVVITNTCGTSTSQIISVTVNPLPEHTLSASQVLCNGSQGTITSQDLSGQTSLTYQWFADGILLAGETNPDINTITAGAYTLEITNTITGCIYTTAASNITVDVITAPAITAMGPVSFCDGASVDLEVAPVAGVTYQWQLDGTDITGATANTISAILGGTYTVTATSVNGCSAASSNSIAVTVDSLPSVATINASGVTTFCNGGSVDLTYSPEAGVTYQWYLDGNAITGATDSLVNATATGVYTVIATNANGCTSLSTNSQVTVNDLPVIPALTASGIVSFCTGGSVDLYFTPEAGVSYQWFLDGNVLTGSTDSLITANNSGAYTVIATNGNGCSSTSVATQVSVNSLPAAPVVTTAGNTTFCAGDSILLETTPVSGLNYQWTMNGTNISGANGSQYVVNATGSYTVIASDLNGCSATATPDVTVTVNPLPAMAVITQSNDTLYSTSASSYQWYMNGVAIPGATSSFYVVTANGNYSVQTGDVNSCSILSIDYPVTNVGISELAGISDGVYPNPSSGIFQIKGDFTKSQDAVYTVYDVTGKVIVSGKLNGFNNTIDLRSNANGVYVLRISGNELNSTVKIIKQ